MKKHLILLTICALAGTAAQPASAKAKGHGANLSTLDKQFLKDAAESNLAELALSPMVLKRATISQDKEYARRMLQDHTKNQALLTRVAGGLGETLPSGPGEEETGVLHALTREPAASFPSAYKREMIRDHTIDIATCHREISLGRNVKVKQYAAQTLPVLQMHLKMARALPTTSGKAGANGAM